MFFPMNPTRCLLFSPRITGALTIVLALLLVACHSTHTPPKLERFQFTSPHMGTTFGITLYAKSPAQAEKAAEAAFRRVAQLEDVLSDYMADSELMRLAENPAGVPVPVSEDLFQVLHRAQEISALTDGAFDMTAGPLSRLWRFSRKRGTLPSAAELQAARASVGWTNLVLHAEARTVTLVRAPLRLDAGGIAKGYAADKAMEVLKAQGIGRALVAAGGDLLTSLPPPCKAGWTVTIAGIGSARPQTLLIGNAAISTSGDTEQFVIIDGVRYAHIVDTATGLGLTNRIHATVIAPDAATSDALATACCILGPEPAIELADSLPNVCAILVTPEDPQRPIWKSDGAP
jgi:thiamine biosynthesis lipoprotein